MTETRTDTDIETGTETVTDRPVVLSVCSYMTDGGLSRYTHCLNRLPDGMAAVRETLHRNTFKGQGDATDR